MNTNAKHTPGPWKYRQAYSNGEPCGIVISPMGYDLNTSNPEENEANARLIASAPKMLEALKSLIEWESIMGGFDSERWTEARAAIAQAEGVQA